MRLSNFMTYGPLLAPRKDRGGSGSSTKKEDDDDDDDDDDGDDAGDDVGKRVNKYVHAAVTARLDRFEKSFSKKWDDRFTRIDEALNRVAPPKGDDDDDDDDGTDDAPTAKSKRERDGGGRFSPAMERRMKAAEKKADDAKKKADEEEKRRLAAEEKALRGEEETELRNRLVAAKVPQERIPMAISHLRSRVGRAKDEDTGEYGPPMWKDADGELVPLDKGWKEYVKTPEGMSLLPARPALGGGSRPPTYGSTPSGSGGKSGEVEEMSDADLGAFILGRRDAVNG